MKYRSDFVTNSSSSSFLISVKNEAVYEPIIHALVVSSGDYDTHKGTLCKTIEEVEEYLLDIYGYKNKPKEEIFAEEYVSEWYNLACKAINDGNVCVFKDIGYDDSGLSSFIEAMCKVSDGMAILKTDEA